MDLSVDKIKNYYPTLWDEDKLILAVEKGYLTEEQFEEIVGVSIYYFDSLISIQNRKQKKNNRALEKFLADQVLVWTDGCKYGVTKEDQEEMALIYTQYIMIKKVDENATLSWHAKKAVNREFSEEEFIGLMIAIDEFVKPYIAKCQQIKEQIYSATTINELKTIDIKY